MDFEDNMDGEYGDFVELDLDLLGVLVILSEVYLVLFDFCDGNLLVGYCQ